MNEATLEPLTQREVERIEFYCKRLRLPRWDMRDIKSFFIVRRNYNLYTTPFNNSSIHIYNEYHKAKNKIFDLGLMNVVDEFTNYLRIEPQLFNKNKLKYPNIPDEENWTLVYNSVDEMISKDINRAKERAKAARGCSVVLIMLILIPISLAVMFNIFI